MTHPSSRRAVISTLVGFLGLAAVFELLGAFWPLLGDGWRTASFGASATLLYALPRESAGWPTSLVANVGSAYIGVGCAEALPLPAASLAAPVIAIGAMSALRMVHPPGGATALLAVVGGEGVRELGWLFPLIPIGLGTAWLLSIRWLLTHRPPLTEEVAHETRSQTPRTQS